MSTVITVENLGKKYLLSHQTQRQPYVALRDVIAERATAMGRRFLHPFSRLFYPAPSPQLPIPATEDFWALKDVSFEINQGDRVGIIGRNGAGKSTLLKILSRIVEPTTGRLKIKGRVASLLEVGTGFHPELTGRENIFLNGAILGMTKAEIKKKFDEIVDFAEIEKFLDTPVKRYSSGMYVRLAFAVAAHLEPEILLIDEVLAVGDAQFQKKCLGKMEEVSSKEGRTILFVSHNMAAVTRLCNCGVWIENGTIRSIGRTDNIVASYLTDTTSTDGEYIPEKNLDIPGRSKIRLISAVLTNDDGKIKSIYYTDESFIVKIRYEIISELQGCRIGFFIINHEGVVVFAPNDNEGNSETNIRFPGIYESCCRIPDNLMNTGFYSVTLSADIPLVGALFFIPNALSFNIERVAGAYSARPDSLPGVICPKVTWSITKKN